MPNGRLNGSEPADDGIPITTNDSTDQGVFRGLIIGTAGSLKITTLAGIQRTYPGVPAGPFPIGCTRVWATGTSAQNIIGVI